MTQPRTEEIEKLRASLAALEGQRALLGDAVIEPALAAIRAQLQALEARAAETASLPVEERRLITILFTDIVGSTSLAEKLDPEEWRRIVAHLHERVGDTIARHGGSVAQYLGDGLLAFFGAQNSREQDAEDAIRAALEFQAEIGDESSAPGLRIRVGIHTGLVVLGELGAEAHKEFTATGDAMNLAARLQSAAPPGGILISDDTYHYVRGVFDVTPQPPLTVKGKSEPLRTYLVRRAKSRAFRVTTRGVTGIRTRTVGRAREMQQLQQAYLDAYENRRVVWVQLVGEAGVGKSRLMGDLDDWIELREETVRVLRGRAFAGEQNQPYALVRRMWFDRFQIADDTPRAQAEARWVARFREYTGITDEEPAQALGLLMGLVFENSPHIGAMRNDANQVKGRAFVVSRQALRAIRAQMPVQMMLEDLQWADVASLDYLREVVMNLDDTSPGGGGVEGMFVLASARPEWKLFDTGNGDGAAAGAGHPTVAISLAPLTDEATRELAAELLQRVQDVPREVVDLIVERAEGVPYFAEEMVNYFIDRGIIDRTREPWRFVEGRLKESPLPATLQHLLLTRLGSLSDAERAALQRGAIFGRSFWVGGVEALGAQASLALLEQLQPRGFVEQQPESALEGESEWVFHHALLREVTYESVLKRERARLHKQAAEWLEQQARQAGRLEEFVGLLGDHCEKAGDLDAAAEWFVRAGEHAMRQGAIRQARGLFDRAIALLPPIAREARWRALTGRVAALAILSGREEQQADLQELLLLAQEMQDDARLAEVWVRQQIAADRAGDYRAAIHAAEQAIAAAERSGSEASALRARTTLAFNLIRQGDTQAARKLGEQVVAHARILGDDAVLTDVLGGAGIVLGELGDVSRATELYGEAAHAARRQGNRFREATWLGNLSSLYVMLGLNKQARMAAEQALALDEALGARRGRAYDLLSLGMIHITQGDGRAAQRVLEDARRELTAVGDDYGLGGATNYLGLELELAGDSAGAARHYAEAMDLFVKIQAAPLVHDLHAGLARCAFGLGKLEEARERVTRVWAYLRENGSEGMDNPIRAYLTCADIFDALGAAAEARAAAEAGYRDLMARAEKISNVEWRKSFLENVADNRAMAEIWERLAV